MPAKLTVTTHGSSRSLRRAPEARDALGTDSSAYNYEVSVVVFYKRPMSFVAPTGNSEVNSNTALIQSNERTAKARVVSTGLNGGEVLLEAVYERQAVRYAEGESMDHALWSAPRQFRFATANDRTVVPRPFGRRQGIRTSIKTVCQVRLYPLPSRNGDWFRSAVPNGRGSLRPAV